MVLTGVQKLWSQEESKCERAQPGASGQDSALREVGLGLVSWFDIPPSWKTKVQHFFFLLVNTYTEQESVIALQYDKTSPGLVLSAATGHTRA